MIIGISGPSGTGKTTISRALRQALLSSQFKHTVKILHQDDFYKPERDLPVKTTAAGPIVNWDCPEALDMKSLVNVLQSYRQHGEFTDQDKADLAARAKEDRNDAAKTSVSRGLLDLTGHRILQCSENILIVDGFMLCHDREIVDLLDVCILLRGSYSTLKARRESRTGYATIEGFWEDPKGYFDDVVWPEYVRTHGHLFQDSNVESDLKSSKIITNEKERLDMSVDTSFSFVLQSIGQGMK